MAGSGALGYRIFTHIGGVAGSGITLDQARLHIDFDGNLGLNTPAVPGVPIQHVSGAHLTFGGVWTDASSRDYKENVRPLTTEQAMQAVTQLVPVTYNYKVDSEERHVGFIAEDVPELVATKDRKSLSPMDIVAALTKVVQEQRQQLQAEKARGDSMEGRLQQLAAEVARLQARVPK
jgi:hypothetical protein